MSSASMHSPPTTHTLNPTSSHPRPSPSSPPTHPTQPPSTLHRNHLPNSSSHHHHHHHHQEWYPRAHDQGFHNSDHPPPAPDHSTSPAQNATFTEDHHHHSHSAQAYRSNYHAYSPQADRLSSFHYPPQSAVHHNLPTSPHSDGTKQEGSLNRTSTLVNPSLRASHTSPQAQTRSDVAANTEHPGGPGRRQPAPPSSFDDTYRETYESPLTHARREVDDGYGLPPSQHSYYSTPRSHREPNNTLFRTPVDSSSSASGSYSHTPSTSFPPPSYPHHSSRFITDDSPGGQSRYGHPTLPEVPVGLPVSSTSASSSTALRQHLPPLSESFGSSFPRSPDDMNPRPEGLGPSPMPLAPSPLDPHGYPTAINTGPGSYPYDHPFDYPREGSPDLVSPGDTSNQASPMRSPAKRGKKVEMACHFCRGRKLKCDGIQPRCQHCSRRGQICTWDSHVRRRGPGLKNKSKDAKGGVSKRRESVSTTSAGRSTNSPKTPARRSLDDLVSAYRGPVEALSPDGEFPLYLKGEDVDGDVPMTTGTTFAPPYPPSSEYTQIPSTTSPQDPYPQTHYPGQQQTQYGPPSPPIRRVIPMSRTPSSSLAGAMGTDPNYSAYPSDNNQGSQQDSAWRRHSIAGGQCGNPAEYISETTGGGAPIAGAGTTSSSASAAYHWDRDSAGGNGPSSYAYSPASAAPAQYFNGQAVHGYPQQQQQQYHAPSSPPSMGYGQQQQYAQPRGYATSRDHHHQQQHQHQPQVSPPMPGYEGGGWFAHAGGPGQAWTGHVGHASADLSSGGDSAAHDHHHERLHDPSFSEIRVQGSVSPSQETDPSSYRAGRSTSGTVSSSSTHSSPAQVAHNLYHLHPISTTTTTTAAVVDMRNRPAPPAMQTSSSADNDLAESLISLRHGPPAGGVATGMVRRVSSVTATSGSETGGTAVPMVESYTMASTGSNDSANHQRTSSSEEGSWAEGRSVPRANNPATITVGQAPAIGFKNALGANSPHSGHEVVY